MKTVFINRIAVLAILVGLTACNSKSENSQSQETATQAEKNSIATPYKPTKHPLGKLQVGNDK